MESQSEVYAQVVGSLPGSPQHVSGGLADVQGVSDVDIVILAADHGEMLSSMPEGTEISSADAEHTVYSIPGYAREVNVYVTSCLERAERSAQHRKVELALETRFWFLSDLARFQKAFDGEGTEKAWAKVLGLVGDPYEAMLDYEGVMARAAEVHQRAAADSPVPVPAPVI